MGGRYFRSPHALLSLARLHAYIKGQGPGSWTSHHNHCLSSLEVVVVEPQLLVQSRRQKSCCCVQRIRRRQACVPSSFSRCPAPSLSLLMPCRCCQYFSIQLVCSTILVVNSFTSASVSLYSTHGGLVLHASCERCMRPISQELLQIILSFLSFYLVPHALF